MSDPTAIARWAQRDRERAAHEAAMERQREEFFLRYVGVVADSLRQFEQGAGLNVEASRAAIVAVQSLLDAGYVFVTMGDPND